MNRTRVIARYVRRYGRRYFRDEIGQTIDHIAAEARPLAEMAAISCCIAMAVLATLGVTAILICL